MLYVLKLADNRTKICTEEPEEGVFYVAVESLPEGVGELMFDEDDNLYYWAGSTAPDTQPPAGALTGDEVEFVRGMIDGAGGIA